MFWGSRQWQTDYYSFGGSIIFDIFFASFWYSLAGGAASCLLSRGERERQKREVYSLIPNLFRRIDRSCESYPRWLMAFSFSHFFLFFLLFPIPLIVSNGIWIYYNYFVHLLSLVTHLINSNMLQLIWLRQWDKQWLT